MTSLSERPWVRAMEVSTDDIFEMQKMQPLTGYTPNVFSKSLKTFIQQETERLTNCSGFFSKEFRLLAILVLKKCIQYNLIVI